MKHDQKDRMYEMLQKEMKEIKRKYNIQNQVSALALNLKNV